MTTETKQQPSTSSNGAQACTCGDVFCAEPTPSAHEALSWRHQSVLATLRAIGSAPTHADTAAALRAAAEYLRPEYAAEVRWLASLYDQPLGRVWLSATGLRLAEMDALAEVVTAQMQEGTHE